MKDATNTLSPATRAQLRALPPRISFLRFDSIIGEGGMSVVWKAWHKGLKRPVAVKVLDADFAANADDVRRFMMEVRLMSSIQHPGIVQGYGASCSDDLRYYFVMEYVDGYTFGSLLARKKRLAVTDTLIICESVADALRYAWNAYKLVHCDIKPDNIMTNTDGQIKLMDLVISQTTAALRRHKQATDVIGTPAYISPEQIYGDVALDCRADIYCLGATLYHLVTGRILFPDCSNDDILRRHVDPARRAPDPRTLNPNVSLSLARLLAGMLVKEREGRYQTWDDVLAAAQFVDAGAGELPPLPAGCVSSAAVDGD